MFCNNQRKSIAIFKGDDTNFEGNRKLYIDIQTEADLSDVVLTFSFLGTKKEFEGLPSDGMIEISFSKEETSKFPLGLSFATLTAEDLDGKVRTIDNRIGILVTNDVRLAYNGDNEVVSIKIGTINADVVAPNEEAQYGQAADARATYLALEDLADQIKSGGGGSGVAQLVIETTYTELKSWRDSNRLITGMRYRISDYVCTTNGVDGITSAGKRFDIVVTALTTNKLSEFASALPNETNNQFPSNVNFSAWKIWYCLDNDTTRFSWALDDSTGRGVIYRMIDEWENDVAYDFKNIKFRPVGAGLHIGSLCFTFSADNGSTDSSLNGGSNQVTCNKIFNNYNSDGTMNITKIYCAGTGIHSNTFESCGGFIVNYGCHNNTFRGANFITLYHLSWSITSGFGLNFSVFDSCSNISIGDNCRVDIRNSTGIAIGSDAYNTNISSSKFITLGNGCEGVYIKNGRNVSVGNGCRYLYFGIDKDNLYPVRNAVIGDGVQIISFTGVAQGSALQNFRMSSGLYNKTIAATTTNKLTKDAFTEIKSTSSYTLSI